MRVEPQGNIYAEGIFLRSVPVVTELNIKEKDYIIPGYVCVI